MHIKNNINTNAAQKGKKLGNDWMSILSAKMLFALSIPELKKKENNKKSTPVWGQTGSSQTCTWHMLQSLLCKYHMRCSGKKLPNWESPLNFPITFPALCCTLIPNTCANKQEEMREVPFLLYQYSLKLGNPPKAVNNKYIVLR